MERTVKFRAWHKTEKVMGNVEVINLDKGAFVTGLSPGGDKLSSDGQTLVLAPKDGRFCTFDEIELMQWSGLQDARGTDIYAGDIFGLSDGAVTKYGWVEFFEGAFVFAAKEPRSGNTHRALLAEVANEMGVDLAGNVHETPQLLEASA